MTAGSWRSLQLASTTSAAQASALAGYGLQANGSQLQINWPTVEISAPSASVDGTHVVFTFSGSVDGGSLNYHCID